MTDLRTAAQQALEALEALRMGMPDSVLARSLDQRIDALKAALAEPDIDPVDEYRKGFIAGQIDMRDRPEEQPEPVQEPDLSRCPQCGGPADNGHDRSIPPTPYFCTKCMAEPVQEQCRGDPGECKFNGNCMYACAVEAAHGIKAVEGEKT